MKRFIWIIVIVAVLALAAAAWLVRQDPAPAPAEETTLPLQEAETVGVTVEIQTDAAAAPERFEAVQVAAGDTALTATDLVAEVVTSGEGANAFVTSINGRAADEAAKEFWLLKINGADSTVGAGAYQVQNGDVIHWAIDTY